MKTYLNLSLAYAAAGLCAGVFYREFTKLSGYTGITMLSRIHPHLLMLGTGVFLLLALFSRFGDLRASRSFRLSLPLYHAGVVLTAVMMLVRGVFQVLGTNLSRRADAGISGMAGIGHILTALGLVLLIQGLKSLPDTKETAA